MNGTPNVPVVIMCRQCRHVLGSATSLQLTIGAAIFTRSVTLRCALCGAQLHWQPQTPLDNAAAVCIVGPESSAG